MKIWMSSIFLIIMLELDLISTSTNLMENFNNNGNKRKDDGCHITVSNTVKKTQLTCTGSMENPKINIMLNNPHYYRPINWIKCIDCKLTIIDETTFRFSETIISNSSINYLEFNENLIRQLKNYAFQRFFLLKVLNLSNNRIDQLELKCFSGLKRLLQLDLSSNQLTILINEIFLDLINLDQLNLSNNRIFLIQPYAFSGLENLKHLQLNVNNLKELSANLFKHVKNLKILHIEHNEIESIHQYAFNNLRFLNYLYLNNNSINYLVPYNFKPLINLVDLQLRLNNLTEIQVSTFNGLKNVKFLYLGKNRIQSIKPYGLIGLDSLIILELIGNEFHIIDINSFLVIPNLIVLWLNYNKINRIKFEFSHDQGKDVQNSLEILDLSSNNLNFIDYESMYMRLPNIKEIILSNNPSLNNCDDFNNFYKFTQQRNISICLSYNCTIGETFDYIESICSFTTTIITLENGTENFNFSLPNSAPIFITYYCFLAQFFLFVNYYY